MKLFNISRLPPLLILKQWTKKATTSSTPPEQGVSNNQEHLTQMERYGSLTYDTNMLNFYASRINSNFIFAKQEIARITAYCKDAFEQNLGSPTPVQVPHMGHQNNQNIVRDPVIVKTKGMENHHGGQVEGLGGLDAKRSRECRMCSSVEQDYRKCPHKLRPNTKGQSASSSQLASFFGPTTTNNHENTGCFVDDSTQESFQSFPFM
uniref:Protein FAR1-RELATED SEQUENCE n=1 Tax=Cannabis sativa TaxID=3483 RepID=A0A803PHZ8_CANSA